MNWRLTRHLGEPEIEVRDPDDRTFGFSILREMARDPANGLEEIGPGVFVGASENSRHRPTPAPARSAVR